MKVLIADDDPSLRFLCRVALESAGHEVILAEDGARVLDLVRDHSPQLLLLDVSMPYVGGLEVLKNMSVEQRRTLPVILLSARARVTERMEGVEAGAIDYVTKPFRPDALARIVNDVLAMSEDARRRYRFALMERLRVDRVREGLTHNDHLPDATSIDLREGVDGSVQSLPRDEQSRRDARRQTAVASLALSAVSGAGSSQLIDEMVFTVADVLQVCRVAMLELDSQSQLICRSVAGPGTDGTLRGKVVPSDASDAFLADDGEVHVVATGGLFTDRATSAIRELWVGVPGCAGRQGAIALECESDEVPDSDDLRFLRVSAGIVSPFLHVPGRNQNQRHTSISGLLRRIR
jgi:CheY-like chemotaxis protein